MGKLLLLPNVLDETLPNEPFLPASLSSAVEQIQGLIVESEKIGRRYLRRFLTHEQMKALPLKVLNEHTTSLEDLLEPLLKGETWGLISDAGLPCIADPGSHLVWQAREKGVEVETFVGPCSLLMALQLSGFSGQHFTFHGYLPREVPDLEKKIKEMEISASKGIAQIWIEAPYRSGKMLEILLKILQNETRLCVAASLTFPTQRVVSATVSQWKRRSFSLGKEPAVFLLG